MYATLSKTPGRIQIDPAAHDDPFYRYKMRQLSLNVVGKGKMIKTFIVNVEEVASDLQIPPEYLVNYLGLRIGANGVYDAKYQKGQRGYISGSHSLERVSEIVVSFIMQFILCGQCSLPELSLYSALISKKEKKINVCCRSCGWKSNIDDLKLPERFCRFVHSHPPPPRVTETNLKVETKRDKDDDVDDKVKKEKEGEEEEEEELWCVDFSADSQKKRAEEMVPENLKLFFDAPK